MPESAQKLFHGLLGILVLVPWQIYLNTLRLFCLHVVCFASCDFRKKKWSLVWFTAALVHAVAVVIKCTSEKLRRTLYCEKSNYSNNVNTRKGILDKLF